MRPILSCSLFTSVGLAGGCDREMTGVDLSLFGLIKNAVHTVTMARRDKLCYAGET